MFKGIDNLFSLSTSEIIDINLKYWLDDSFLNIGAYTNITIPTSGIYGGDQHRLFPVKNRLYEDGQVWKSHRSNWVWESGLDPESIRVSGAYINGNFSTDLIVDYNNGQIIFNEAQSLSSKITTEYSYKLINVYSANEVEWFNDIQPDSFRLDRHHFGLSGELQYDRTQLPAIVYEHFSKTFRPYQLGLGHWSENTIIFHILTEDRPTANKLADILSEQTDKTVMLFDPQLVSDSGVWPLSGLGELNDGAMTYNQLIESDFKWRKMYLLDGIRQKTNKLDNSLFHTPVRFNIDLTLTEI